MHLILLSGENLKLARLEAERLLSLEHTNLVGNLLYCTIPTDKFGIMNRLAYAKKIYEVMYVTARKNLEESLKAYPWINYYEKNFCLRITSEEHYDERYYSGFVWDSLEKNIRPKVNLENPGLFIELFIDKDRATVTRLVYQNFETFEDRKAHLRPVLHPTAMHPKMARALINILNPGPKDRIIDPFCGACGILTEAGLLGLKFEGYDIDSKILDDARKNMEYYDIPPEHYNLVVKDSTKVKGLDNIVTDLPYGKSSKKSHELIDLYSIFLKNISGKAVVVMPSFMPYKALLDKNLPKQLAVTNIISHYIHKSLTRKIIVIDRKIQNIRVRGLRKLSEKESKKSHDKKAKNTKIRTSSNRRSHKHDKHIKKRKITHKYSAGSKIHKISNKKIRTHNSRIKVRHNTTRDITGKKVRKRR